MTEPYPLAPPDEDRSIPAVVYGLYLLGLINGLTIFVGLIVAYANKDGAGPRMQSHYVFQIRTFWTAIAWWVVGLTMLFWGAILSFILVGIPILVLGGLIFAVGHIWFALRCVLGIVYLSRGEAYPRPRTWLI